MPLVDVITERLTAWGLTSEPEAAAALDLAERLSVTDLRPAAAAMLHAQLGLRLSDLRKLAPEEKVGDEIDDLKAQVLTLLPRVEESG